MNATQAAWDFAAFGDESPDEPLPFELADLPGMRFPPDLPAPGELFWTFFSGESVLCRMHPTIEHHVLFCPLTDPCSRGPYLRLRQHIEFWLPVMIPNFRKETV